MKDAIIVLGMHRSGTSALTGVLNIIGAKNPASLMRADQFNERGYFESTEIVALNDAILSSAATSWKDWRRFNPRWNESATGIAFRHQAAALIQAEYGGAPLIALKDPRICRLVPFWLAALREVEYKSRGLIVIRSPLEMAHSLKRAQGLSQSRSLLIWLRYVLDSELETRELQRSVVLWSQLLDDWRSVMGRVAEELVLQWPRQSDFSGQEVDQFLSYQLRHNVIDDQKLLAHGAVNEWVKTAYEALIALSREPNSNSALGVLDQVRSDFDRTAKIYGPMFADLETDLERVQSIPEQLKSAETQRDLALAQLDESVLRSSSLAESLNDAETALSTLRCSLAENASALAQVSERLSLMGAERLAMQEELEGLRETLALSAERERLLANDKIVAQEHANQLSIELDIAHADAVIFREGQALSAERERDLAEKLAAVRAEAAARTSEMTQALERAAGHEQALLQRLAAAASARDVEAAQAVEKEQFLSNALAQSEFRRSAAEALSASLEVDLEAVLSSTSWKLASAIATIAKVVPAPLRQFARRAAQRKAS